MRRPEGGGLRKVYLLAVVFAIAAMGAVSAWHDRYGARALASAEVVEHLQAIQARERLYLEATRAYSTNLVDLGMEAWSEPDGWSFRILASRVGGKATLLVEADDGSQRLAIDGQGRLLRSTLAPLPNS